MNQEMFAQLNQQISNEFHNSFVYLSISNFYQQQKFLGLAHHYRKQSDEERYHALKINDYLLKFESDYEITPPVSSDIQEWDNLFIPLDASLALEKLTTEQINRLVSFAIQQNDYATEEFLQWYVTEQVNEEFEANYMIRQARLNGVYNELTLRLFNDRLVDQQLH